MKTTHKRSLELSHKGRKNDNRRLRRADREADIAESSQDEGESTVRRVTFWLYNGKECIGCVRAPEGTSDNDVRSRAVMDAINFPIFHKPFQVPFEHQNALHRARVVTHDD